MTVQPVSARASVGGVTLRPTEVRLRTGRFDKAAEAVVTGVAQGSVPEGAPLSLSVNDTQVFRGRDAEILTSKQGSLELRAYGPIRDLKQTTIQQEFVGIGPEQVIAAVCEEAGVEVEIEAGATPPRPGGLGFAQTASNAAPLQTSASIEGQSAAKVVRRAARWLEAVYFVDAEGTLQVTTTPEPEQHTADKLIEASAGKRTPPFRSVRVIGSSPTDREGQEARHLLTRRPITATAGNGTPEYVYRDRDIRSPQQASNVANSLLKEFRKQRRGGYLVVLGDPDIRPLDTIRMPDRLGGEQYLASAVEHTLSARDGFETRIECGGVVEESDAPTPLTEPNTA